MKLIQSKSPNTIVAYYIICNTCKKEILSIEEFASIRQINKPEDELVIDKTTSDISLMEICKAHIKETGHSDLFNRNSVIATFECIICRELCKTKEGLKVMESWALDHERSTSHSFFKYNYDHDKESI